jgi:AcrR family transcriptional regulator
MRAAPSRRESRRAREIARRRRDALAGASVVFAAKGYHEAQMTEIAEAAELSRASLYAMFKGKDELFQEVITSTALAVRDAVTSDVEALDDPGQQLLCVVDCLFTCFEENQHLVRLYALGTHALPFKMRELAGDPILQLFLQFTEWVSGIARRAKRAGYLRGLDPQAVGVSLVGAVTTAAMHSVEATPDRPLSHAAPPIRAIFQQLLQKSERP